MSNPLDLLYTNRFVATNDIHFNDDLSARDRINTLKTIDQPFPKRLNRNWEPIITESVRDIVKNRYKKHRITSVCIDSRDRNYHTHPNPANYTVVLSRQLNYIESFNLKGINFTQLPVSDKTLIWRYPLSEDFTITIPCGTYTSTNLAQVLTSRMNSLINPANQNRLQNFAIDIDVVTNTIRIISRLESPEILAAQTILTAQDDIFGGGQSNPAGLYILVNQSDIFSDGNYPLIPTGLPILGGIGGFPADLFNYRAFWFQSTDPSQNSYDFVDTITINGINYRRYLLTPRSPETAATSSQNIIFSQGLSQVINGSQVNFSGVFSDGAEHLPTIGRAQEFALDFNQSNVLDIFNWIECGENFDHVLTNRTERNVSRETCFNMFQNPGCCNYVFTVEPYIFMRLSSPSFPKDTLANNVVISQKLPAKNVCDAPCSKDNTNIFARIVLGNPIRIESVPLRFYETQLESVNGLTVTFLDKDGCILNFCCDNSISMDVIETIDVLKDTLIDSRHGEANAIGNTVAGLGALQ